MLEKDTQWMRNELIYFKKELDLLLRYKTIYELKDSKRAEASDLIRKMSILQACLSNPKYITVIKEAPIGFDKSGNTNSLILDAWVIDSDGKRTPKHPTFPLWAYDSWKNSSSRTRK